MGRSETGRFHWRSLDGQSRQDPFEKQLRVAHFPPIRFAWTEKLNNVLHYNQVRPLHCRMGDRDRNGSENRSTDPRGTMLQKPHAREEMWHQRLCCDTAIATLFPRKRNEGNCWAVHPQIWKVSTTLWGHRVQKIPRLTCKILQRWYLRLELTSNFA